MNLDMAEIGSVASGLGGAGLGARVLLQWISQGHKEKQAENRAKLAAAMAFNKDATKMFFAGIERVGGFVLVAFAAAALFVMLSPIILPLVADVSVTVYLPKTLNLWIVEIDRLKTIHTGLEVGALDADGKLIPVKEILLLPIHFAFCTNIFGFWVADRGLKS